MAPDDGCLTDNECQGHYNQAVKLFEGGRFESALPEFQAAYQRRQMPWLLINIGRTLHRLGRSREALEHYERYKQAETKPDPETLERVEKYIAQARVLTENTTTTGTVATIPPAEIPLNQGTGVDQPKPIYKKWWFWTAIGGGVVAIVIIGAAAGAASSRPASVGLPSDVPRVSFTF
jgi:tetratricopeptide (TPR) repeat protein